MAVDALIAGTPLAVGDDKLTSATGPPALTFLVRLDDRETAAVLLLQVKISELPRVPNYRINAPRATRF